MITKLKRRRPISGAYHFTQSAIRLPFAAWFYPNPSPAADRIKGRVAFWHGVKVDQVL